MTTQIEDKLIYKNKKYDVISINDDLIFNPREYNIQPVFWLSSCWKGFLAEYEIKENQLLLQNLYICLNKSSEPEIKAPLFNNVDAMDITKKNDTQSDFEYLYKNLNFNFEYTGYIILFKQNQQNEKIISFGKKTILWGDNNSIKLEFDEGYFVNAEILSYNVTEYSTYNEKNSPPEIDEEIEY